MRLRGGIVVLSPAQRRQIHPLRDFDFDAIVENGKAQAACFLFCAMNPNIGVVAIPDARQSPACALKIRQVSTDDPKIH
ncbi:hypothetical protein GUJ93_ZPchr0013g34225 [Zizania palustris]|uniref:Uncharacterized protein n=1 Tax=Zizania palustris TaxID=103762 RepID=A0A8J5WZB6_ZIZPA|nr:hypothetical protein GUJ93_ZPchr0013g34225 [Zizania palustris]